MIKFDIQTADLKYIMSALKPAVAKSDCRPTHQYIKFECVDGNLTTYATDGYRIHSVTVHVDITEGDNKFSFLLKPFTVPKTDSDFTPCELSEKEIMFNFGEQKITFQIGNPDDFINVNEAIPTGKVKYRVGFDSKFLFEAAKTLKKGRQTPLIMEFRSPLDPVMIYGDKDKSDFRMVLPMRLRRETQE